MGDTIPVRVFDSITAAVENSAPPEPPPYAEIQNPQAAVSGPEDPEPVPVVQTPPESSGGGQQAARKTAARRKPTGVTAHAGTAGIKTKANDPK